MFHWGDDVNATLHAQNRRGARRVAFALLTSGALGVAACGGQPERPAGTAPPAPTSVEVATASVIDMEERFDEGGVVQANVSATVSSRVLAPVLAVLVSPGDRVRTGQLLVTLDDRDLAATAAQGRSSMAAAEHAERAAQAEREGAEAALALAEASLGRVRRLHDRTSATAQELDEAVAQTRSAESRLAATQARVDQATAAREAARAGLDATTVVAGFARINAPFAGRVTEKLVEPGEMASPGAPLLRLESTDGWRVDVRVDESRATHLAPGQQLTVRLGEAGADGPSLRGTVREVARAVDAGERAVLVKVGLPTSASQGELRSGTFARVSIPGAVRRALVVPTTAVVKRGQVATLFVIENTLARARLVQVGGIVGATTEIRSGLEAGERVVVSPPPSLRDRTPVAGRAAAVVTAPVGPSTSGAKVHD